MNFSKSLPQIKCQRFSALTAKEKVAFGMSNDAELGVWDLRECLKNLTFDALMQKCTPNLGINMSNCAMPKTGDTALVPIFYFRELAAGSIAQGCYSQCHGLCLCYSKPWQLFSLKRPLICLGE